MDRKTSSLFKEAMKNLTMPFAAIFATNLVSPVIAQTNVSLSTGSIHFHEFGVNQATRSFFGSGNGGSGTGSPISGRDLTLPDTELQMSRSVGLNWDKTLGEISAFDFNVAVNVEIGQSRYFLPNGVDVFVDPVTVSFRYASVASKIETRFPINSFLDVGLGAGIEAIAFDTSITSALLDIQSSHKTANPFAEFSLRAQLQKDHKLYGTLDITHFENLGTDAQFGIAFAF